MCDYNVVGKKVVYGICSCLKGCFNWGCYMVKFVFWQWAPSVQNEAKLRERLAAGLWRESRGLYCERVGVRRRDEYHYFKLKEISRFRFHCTIFFNLL